VQVHGISGHVLARFTQQFSKAWHLPETPLPGVDHLAPKQPATVDKPGLGCGSAKPVQAVRAAAAAVQDVSTADSMCMHEETTSAGVTVPGLTSLQDLLLDTAAALLVALASCVGCTDSGQQAVCSDSRAVSDRGGLLLYGGVGVEGRVGWLAPCLSAAASQLSARECGVCMRAGRVLRAALAERM
jgi:hypothetical protein